MSLMKDGLSTINGDKSFNLSFGPDPYEDPALVPGFVRSTKEYLKQAHIFTIQKQLKKEEEVALKRALSKKGSQDQFDGMSSGMSFMPHTSQIPLNSGRNEKLCLT